MVGIIVVIVLAVLLLVSIRFVVALQQAKKAYYDSLTRLKEEPHNAAFAEKTLALGLKYASVLRSAGLAWVFDRVALLNDINCAKEESEVVGEADNSRPSVEKRLAKLEDRRRKNLLTEGEHQQRRRKNLKDR